MQDTDTPTRQRNRNRNSPIWYVYSHGASAYHTDRECGSLDHAAKYRKAESLADVDLPSTNPLSDRPEDLHFCSKCRERDRKRARIQRSGERPAGAGRVQCPFCEEWVGMLPDHIPQCPVAE